MRSVNPGVGSKGVIPTTAADLEAALEMGMDWSLREGYAWAGTSPSHDTLSIHSGHVKSPLKG